METVTHTSHVWDRIFCHDEGLDSEAKVELLRTGLAGFDVVRDVPCHALWWEILQAFPDAKVIFYERPIEQWWPSFVKQIESFYQMPVPPDFIKIPMMKALNPTACHMAVLPSYFGTFYG